MPRIRAPKPFPGDARAIALLVAAFRAKAAADGTFSACANRACRRAGRCRAQLFFAEPPPCGRPWRPEDFPFAVEMIAFRAFPDDMLGLPPRPWSGSGVFPQS